MHLQQGRLAMALVTDDNHACGVDLAFLCCQLVDPVCIAAHMQNAFLGWGSME